MAHQHITVNSDSEQCKNLSRVGIPLVASYDRWAIICLPASTQDTVNATLHVTVNVMIITTGGPDHGT